MQAKPCCLKMELILIEEEMKRNKSTVEPIHFRQRGQEFQGGATLINNRFRVFQQKFDSKRLLLML